MCGVGSGGGGVGVGAVEKDDMYICRKGGVWREDEWVSFASWILFLLWEFL